LPICIYFAYLAKTIIVQQTNPGGGSLQILLLLAILIPAIFFLLTQQNTLKAIKAGNRPLHPGLVWLQLIPLFGQVWQFFIVTRIARSIKKEIAFRNDNSILGFPDAAAVEESGKNPTFILGITYCALNTAAISINFCDLSDIPWMRMVAGLCALSGTVCWIIYWVQLGDYKRKLARFAD
jgi:hypothetical protein